MILPISSGNLGADASVNKLLPPHLHEEIDSTSYRPPSGHRQQGSPAPLGQSSTSKPRSVPGSASVSSQSKPPAGGSLGDFSLRPNSLATENQLGGRESRGSHPAPGASPSLTPGQNSQFAARGPSPILPPIQDLRSLPERNLNQRGNPYSVPAHHSGDLSRDDFESPKYHDPELDRPGAQPYRASATPLPSIETRYTPSPYDSSRYGQYGRPYRSDLEYSPQHANSPQNPNFGVLGDPVDPRNKRRRGNLPKPVTDILRSWFLEHLDHPYPSEEDKQMFITRTGLTISQVSIQTYSCLPLRPFGKLLTLNLHCDRLATGLLTLGGAIYRLYETKPELTSPNVISTNLLPSAIPNIAVSHPPAFRLNDPCTSIITRRTILRP